MRSRRPRSGSGPKEAPPAAPEPQAQQKQPEPEPVAERPVLDLGSLRRQFEELIDDFFGQGPTRRMQPRPAESDQSQIMPLNVVETEESIVILAPLPGLLPDDIDISVRGQMLSLRALRRDPYHEGGAYKRREWPYGPYHRTVELTSPVDPDSARATYRQGVVTLTLPKSDAARSRPVPVETDPAETAETEASGEPSLLFDAPADVDIEVEAGGEELDG